MKKKINQFQLMRVKKIKMKFKNQLIIQFLEIDKNLAKQKENEILKV